MCIAWDPTRKHVSFNAVLGIHVQGVCGADRYKNSSVLAVARNIVKREGPGALWRGMRPRVLFHTPAAAICWSTYEAGKSLLQQWNDDQRLSRS